MAGPAGWVAKEFGWINFWGFTIVAAIPGMVLLWILWSKGYVGEGIRQSTTIDETKLKEPVGALRIAGFLLILAGLVGVLLSKQLEADPNWLYASLASFAVGMTLAWKRKAIA